MAFYTVQDGPWPQGTTVAVWPTSSVTGGVPAGPALDTAVAYPDGTATFGGLTVGVSYTAIGSGGTVVFVAGATGGGGGTTTVTATGANVLIWSDDESNYVVKGASPAASAAMRADTSSHRTFVGPADPATIASITLSDYDIWRPTV